jgi:aldehyde dehydrogenase (NAD+)
VAALLELPEEGCFYPPTLFTDVSPAATIAQEEIFGPVVVLMTFRTHAEAVELANNTRYGLAASVWTENINLALDVAPKLKAGTVWINSTNLFDAAPASAATARAASAARAGARGCGSTSSRRGSRRGDRGRSPGEPRR